METPIAEAIAVNRVHVFVLCPFCGEIHLHGSGGKIHEDAYGGRGAHCIDRTASCTDYNIQCTPRTVRLDQALTRRDVRRILASGRC